MACLAVYAQHTANLIRWIMKKLGELSVGDRDSYSREGVATLFLHVTAFLNEVDWSYLTSHWSIAVTCQNNLRYLDKNTHICWHSLYDREFL